MNNAPRAERVSTLELFFDLVFVVTITQLTAVIRAEPTVLVGLGGPTGWSGGDIPAPVRGGVAARPLAVRWPRVGR